MKEMVKFIVRRHRSEIKAQGHDAADREWIEMQLDTLNSRDDRLGEFETWEEALAFARDAARKMPNPKEFTNAGMLFIDADWVEVEECQYEVDEDGEVNEYGSGARAEYILGGE